jgi:CheY-like chemotaxis protein
MSRTKILIVEDEGLIALDLSMRLKRDGFEVIGISSSGEDALRTLSRATPDLILMDIRLEGAMDGIEAADKVRADFGLPVVFLTAHADPATLSRAKASSPFGYLLKPFTAINFSVTIEMALNKYVLEKKLTQRLRWLANLALSGPDPMIATDSRGAIQFMNAEAARMLDCLDPDWSGRRFQDMMPLYKRNTGRAAEDFVDSALNGKTSSRDEIFALPRGLCFRNNRNREITIEGAISLGLLESNEEDPEEHVGAIISFRDVSV